MFIASTLTFCLRLLDSSRFNDAEKRSYDAVCAPLYVIESSEKSASNAAWATSRAIRAAHALGLRIIFYLNPKLLNFGHQCSFTSSRQLRFPAPFRPNQPLNSAPARGEWRLISAGQNRQI